MIICGGKPFYERLTSLYKVLKSLYKVVKSLNIVVTTYFDGIAFLYIVLKES